VTVCVAALASGGDCIVCVADKALSYGEYLQWDSDVTKIIPLKSGKGVMMISGGENSSRVVNALRDIQKLGSNISETISKIERAYQTVYDEILEIKFIKQNGLTRDSYLSAVTGLQINRHIEHISEEIEGFDLDVHVLICGHDDTRSPFLLAVKSPGKVVDVSREGFHAIGSGFDHALARLLMHDHKRTHGFAETLYECFDAKAHSEMASGVGFEWDAYFVVARSGQGSGVVAVDEEVKPLLDRVWTKANRTPYYKRKKDDLPNPPRDWKLQFHRIVAKSLKQVGIASSEGHVEVVENHEV
jgi:20S proteasome alpha/beta subunit